MHLKPMFAEMSHLIYRRYDGAPRSVSRAPNRWPNLLALVIAATVLSTAHGQTLDVGRYTQIDATTVRFERGHLANNCTMTPLPQYTDITTGLTTEQLEELARINGRFVVPALYWESYQQMGWIPSNWRRSSQIYRFSLVDYVIVGIAATACDPHAPLPEQPNLAPNGTYRISVPVEVVIVDPSGQYSDTVGGMTVSFSLACDDVGKITGAGTATASRSGVDINLDLTYTGTISGSGRAIRLTLTIKGSGTARLQDQTYPVTYTGAQKAQYDPHLEAFVGNVRIRVCVREGGRNACESVNEAVTVDIPGDDVGAWQSTVTIATDSRNRTLGTGTLTLATNRRFEFTASGKYNPKRDQVQLKLAGGVGGRAKLAVTAQPANGVLIPSKLSGKVLGQTVKR